MKFNIANPAAGLMKCIDIDDEKTLAAIYDKRMSEEVPGELLGSGFEGYVFRIAGGNDKQGFPMMQGVLVSHRVRLLLSKGMTYYRPRRKGERKRKSVRGCIVGPDLSVVQLVLVKKGDGEVPGLTDEVVPARLGPKRANKVRKYFDLPEDADPRDFTVKRIVERKGGKTVVKKPKVQRLITPRRLQHKAKRQAARKAKLEESKAAALEYKHLLEQRAQERRASAAARKSSRKGSRAAEV